MTRLLASTAEMVDAGNIVILHKTGGMIKQLTKEQQGEMLARIKDMTGPQVPITRKYNVFNLGVDVDDMEVDQAGFGEKTYAAFWEDESRFQWQH